MKRLHPIFDRLNDRDAKRAIKILAECKGPEDKRLDEVIDILSGTRSPRYVKSKKPTLVQTLNKFIQETIG